MKDVTADFYPNTPAEFHLVAVISQVNKTKQNTPRFLQVKNSSTLLSKIRCHLGSFSRKEGAQMSDFPGLVRRSTLTGSVKGKHEGITRNY